MQFVFDHLISFAVAGVVILLVATMSLTQAEGTRDMTKFYGLQRVKADFVDRVESDLTSAGVGVPSGASAVQIATAERFAFYGVVDPSGATGLIEYREVPAGIVDGALAWSVERYVDGALTGRSAGVVARFEVELLDDAGNPIGAGRLGDTREVRVETEWIVPHAEEGGGARRQALRRSAWTTHIRPLALQ